MENIQVALRIRPLNKYEARRSEEYVWYTSDNRNVSIPNSHYKELVLAKRLNPNTKTNFCFDYCFTPEDENNTVYEKLVRRIALSSLKGINGTIFMYGQTGSGKTYTMMGYDEPESQDISYSRSGSPIGRRSPTKRYPQSPNASMFSYESPSPGKHKRSADFQTAAEAETQEIYNRDLNENTGILILALKELFKTIENDLEKTYFLRCSYVEIYNDQVYDLLKDTSRLGEVLSVNEGAQKEFYIKGVTEEPVSSIDDILEKLRRGEAHRHYASTIMNHVSSRSHTIFRLMVQTVSSSFIKDYRGQQQQQDDPCNTSNINNQELRMHIEAHLQAKTGQKTVITESLLNFVDLAGSEKVSNHHQFFEENDGIITDAHIAATMVRDRVKEGQHINKSLFFLTQVISLKSEGKGSQHIPYRNSPLTKILRSSLGGNSRTLIILCANPTGSQVEQTLSTLRFGMNAKKIENRVQANIVTNDEGNVFKLLISDYERKIKDLESLRSDDQSRISELLHTAADLSSQRSVLQEKIENLCKLQVKRIASGNIPADELALFFKQARERNLHFDDVGILFSGKGITKYDTKKSAWDSEDDDEKNTLEGKNRAQEMLNLCNIAKLRMTNQEIELLRKKITTLQENFEGLSARNIGNYEQYLNVQEEGKFLRHELNEKWKESQKKLFSEYEKIKERLEKLVIDYNQQLEVNNDLMSTLELFRDMIGITELSDENLLSIERHLWAKIDDVKTEKARRVVEKETGHSIRKESEVKKKPLNKLGLSLNELDESIIAELETETSIVEEDKLKSIKILREKGEFNEIFNKGIAEINEELEKSLKFSFEAEGLLKRDNEIILLGKENIEIENLKATAIQEFMDSNPCFKLDFSEKLDEFDLRAMFEDRSKGSESKGGSASGENNKQETDNKIQCIDNDYTIEQESFDGLNLVDSNYNSLIPQQQIPTPERVAKIESLEYSEEEIEDLDAGVADLSREVAQNILSMEQLSRSQTPTRGVVSKGTVTPTSGQNRSPVNGGFKKAATKVVSQVRAAWGSNKKTVSPVSAGKIDTMKSKSKPNSREGSISAIPKKLTGSKSHKQLMVLPAKEEHRNYHYSPVFGGNNGSAKGFGSAQKKEEDAKINMKRFIESGRSSLNINNKTLDLEVHLANARKLVGQKTVEYEKKQGDFMQVAQELYKHQYSKSLVGNHQSQPQQQSTVYTNSFFEDNKPGFDISASEIKMKDNGSDRYQSEAYLRSFNSSMLDVDDKLEISGLGNNILGGDGVRKRRTREERMKNKALSKGGY